MRLISVAAAAFAALFLGSASVAAPAPALKTPLEPAPAKTVAAPAATPGVATPALTRPDLEAWLDGYMPYALQRGDIAGAVVVVVKDGQILLQKGYGYADVAKKQPVDAATTLFRPGSVSKLFTWTAVMQQVERRKIDLDADINTYLDFKMPPGPDAKPITMRDIMTHTAGFEEAIKELIGTDADKTPKLGAVVKRWTPTRIFPAGSTPAYSNYATALAGYVVERTSGLDFDTYVERNIFAPLGMTHASFRHKLPPALMANMSKGYLRGSGKPGPYEIVGLGPAGSLAATGQDMGAFMIAHLQDGAYGANRILAPETARLMHDSGREQLPPLNRMMLGFYESNTNGRRIISHGGDTQYFHSDLNLFLDDGVGIYISMNSTGKGGAAGPIRAALLRQFADRYLPGPGPTGKVDAKTAAEHAKMIAGAYVSSRRADRSLLSVTALLSEAKVVANPDGTITFSMVRGFNDVPKKWREIAPFVWVETDGKARLAAKVVDGKVVRFGIDNYPFMVFDKAPVAKAAFWLMPATMVALGAIALTVVLWPINAIVRWRYRQPFPLEGRDAQAHRWVRIGAAAAATSVAAWIGTVVSMLDDLSLVTAKTDWWLQTLHVLGTLGVFAGVGLTAWNVWVVWSGKRSWFARLWSIVLLLSTLVLAWVAIAYHLVGLGAEY
jgi:CubicO group peptidase (beta-lactamase class C family)